MRKRLPLVLVAALLVQALSGCGEVITENSARKNHLSREDAETELSSLLKKVDVTTIKDPVLDIYSDELSKADALADISTFPVTVEGKGVVDVEIATPSEFSGEAPDDWLNVMARRFNESGAEVDGKRASVSIRRISSGETVTYINAGAYRPGAYIPSNYAFGMMLEASGVDITKVSDRIAGNTAGILVEKGVYNSFLEKYGEASLQNILTAANAGNLQFAYTNPYTSATGLNILTAMLKAFDPADPLSDTAQKALLDYQRTSPPVAYTTGVLRNQARKGIISAMVMEEQAYTNTPELKGYEYFPVGIRHDHPVYSFGWNTEEQNAVLKQFVDHCLSTEAQKLATEKGFNRHEEYRSDDSGLTGTGYLSAQGIWKRSKNGGRPIVAAFVADVSGSMRGDPIVSLKESLVAASSYIGSDHYVGLVSYSDGVTVNLPIARFDEKQRAYFAGEVKALTAAGGTATYDAVLVALQMIEEKLQEVPDGTPMLFVLTDGEQNQGYALGRITGIVGGLAVPVYCIAYNYSDNGELQTLSEINEAAVVSGNSEDIVNQLRNLFNVQL